MIQTFGLYLALYSLRVVEGILIWAIRLFKACRITLNNAQMVMEALSVIHKEGKDNVECGFYWLISVLNVNYKLSTAFLAKRLEKILPQLVHNDQTGFISQRQTHDDIKRSLHKPYPTEWTEWAFVLGLDAEKAFDSVTWPLLGKSPWTIWDAHQLFVHYMLNHSGIK